MPASENNKALARYLRSVLGGSPTVSRYWDEAHRNHVDILRATDSPDSGVTTYATLGLSDFSTGLQVSGTPLGVELLMAAGSHFVCTPNVVATCAFNLINSKMQCHPGQVYTRVLDMYRPNSAMKHAMFVPPFLWSLETQVFPEKTVAWLLAVPISDGEHAVVQKEGSDHLENLLEQSQVDIFNFDREPIV